MKYRDSSLFTKYKIEPDITSGKLRALFQADPNKRRDLPIVNKVLSSPQLLLEEELFTPHEESDTFLIKHAKVLQQISCLRGNANSVQIGDLEEAFIYLCTMQSEWDHFFYMDELPPDVANSTVKDFFECLYDEIARVVINTIGDIASESTISLYGTLAGIADAIEWLKERKTSLDEDLCEYVDNSLSIGDASDSFSAKLGCILSIVPAVNNKYYLGSVRYVIDKMVDDTDTYGDILLDNYEKILSAFSGRDILQISSFITRVGNKYCDIKVIDSNIPPENVAIGCTKVCTSIEQLKSSGVVLSAVEDGKYQFDPDELNICYQIAGFLSKAGSSWYSDYRKYLLEVKEETTAENMYRLVSHILKAKPNAKIQNILTNIIMGESSFQPMIEFILEAHKDLMDKNTTKYLDPDDIDDFIATYYWIIYTLEDKEVFNEKFFNSIRMFSLDCLSSASKAMEFFNLVKGVRSDLSRTAAEEAKKAMTRALSNIPKDFFVDDTLRAVDAIKNFGGVHTGSVSKSSLYIDKYCDLFGKKRTKYGRQAYENKQMPSTTVRTTSSSSNSSSGCCYVATAVYGSYDCPEVWTLRRFRDYELANTWYGRAFVHMYYAISPTIVKWFGNTGWFKKMWRGVLDKMVNKLRAKGYESSPYEDKQW